MNLFLKPRRLGQRVYLIIKFGIVIIKVVTVVLAVILEAFEVYCEGDFKWGVGKIVFFYSPQWILSYKDFIHFIECVVPSCGYCFKFQLVMGSLLLSNV
ncbi:putative organic solute transporter subunit alpha/Transmembrane protein [Helianthus annuus]|nr:putative organic solute transporter subunit alpha/Transmembrane protein [Helianthus annuus]